MTTKNDNNTPCFTQSADDVSHLVGEVSTHLYKLDDALTRDGFAPANFSGVEYYFFSSGRVLDRARRAAWSSSLPNLIERMEALASGLVHLLALPVEKTVVYNAAGHAIMLVEAREALRFVVEVRKTLHECDAPACNDNEQLATRSELAVGHQQGYEIAMRMARLRVYTDELSRRVQDMRLLGAE